MADDGREEIQQEDVALHRQNEQLTQLLGQAIRMGEGLLVPARDAVNAYHEYVRMAALSAESAEPAGRRLAKAMDKLSRLVGEAKQPPTEGANKRSSKSRPAMRRSAGRIAHDQPDADR